MATLPKRAAERIAAGIKRFQPILRSAKTRDINEPDTVVVVTDLLQEIFGYDKYTDITAEHRIRGTFGDLAVKIDGTLAFLVEVKAIGRELREPHIKPVVSYAANRGVDWVVLTNGITWRVYKVTFAKPVNYELVVEIDLLAVNHRNAAHLETVGVLAKEGWQRAHRGEDHPETPGLSRFVLGALILSDPVVNLLGREIRRLMPAVRVQASALQRLLESEVLKGEVLAGTEAETARKQLARAASRAGRASRPVTGARKRTRAPVA